jgi:hypothetical protein
MRWVSPFGYPRIKGCSHLPTAFRSVPRPSSPLNAKASSECPFALDFLSLLRKISYSATPRINALLKKKLLILDILFVCVVSDHFKNLKQSEKTITLRLT